MPRPFIPCVVDGCYNKKHHANPKAAKKGLCKEHWEADVYERAQQREHEALKQRLCSFEGCNEAHRAHGYCQGHNWQYMNNLPLAPLKRNQTIKGECSVEDCVKPVYAKGYCRKHYVKARRSN